jgi:hypothetical protein
LGSLTVMDASVLGRMAHLFLQGQCFGVSHLIWFSDMLQLITLRAACSMG